jgi:hypothetical protein
VPTSVDHGSPDDTMYSVLDADFQTACAELFLARRWQQRKDTSANRAAVAVALTGVDAVLDSYLDVRGFLRRAAGATSLVP